jgi:hypothetical protein
MAHIEATVLITVYPAGSDSGEVWEVSEQTTCDSGNPLFHAAEVSRMLHDLAGRAQAGVTTRFGSPPVVDHA